MRFRPCIDIHNGRVKQIIGGSLDDSRGADENFISDKDAAYYAELYKEAGLKGGHIINLNKPGTAEYDASREQALRALRAYPGGMQIGGSINAGNAQEYIDAGASHVIVTSYIFHDGCLDMEHLNSLIGAVGREHITIDLSCRKNNGSYYVVTDRWQSYTDVEVTPARMKELSEYCDEFLVHGVDVEGKRQGIDIELLSILAGCRDVTVTYAGGVHSESDIDVIETIGDGRIDYTVGTALDIFGGNLEFGKLCGR